MTDSIEQFKKQCSLRIFGTEDYQSMLELFEPYSPPVVAFMNQLRENNMTI